MVQDPRLDKPPDIKVDVAELVEAHQGPHPVIAVVGHYRDIAGVGEVDRVVGDGLEAQGERETGARQHMAGAVEHHGLGQPAQGRLGRDHLLQALGVERQGHSITVEVVGHRQDIGADRLLMLVQISFSDGQRFGNRGTHPFAEPRLHAKAEEKIGKPSDDDRRHYRDQAEQHHQPYLQPRAGEAPAPLGPHLDQTLGDDRAKRQQQDQVEVEQGQDGTGMRPEGGCAGQSEVRRDPRSQSRDRKRDCKLAAETDTAGPDSHPPHRVHSRPLTEVRRGRF